MNYELRIKNEEGKHPKTRDAFSGPWKLSAKSYKRPIFAGQKSGFTLIELIVSMAIFVIITGLVMVNQRRFGGNILITNLGYDVALSIRQAQVYGISTKATGSGSFNSQFGSKYGVHFASIDSYVLFVDLDGNGKYDTGANTTTGCTVGYVNPECLTFYKLQQNNYISQFCVNNGATCTPTLIGLDVLFSRPNPEPIVVGYTNAGTVPATSASITVSSPQGVTKQVTVSAVGQMSVQ